MWCAELQCIMFECHYALQKEKGKTFFWQKQNLLHSSKCECLTIYSVSLNNRSKRQCVLSMCLLLSETSVWNNNLHLLKIFGFKTAVFSSVLLSFFPKQHNDVYDKNIGFLEIKKM